MAYMYHMYQSKERMNMGAPNKFGELPKSKTFAEAKKAVLKYYARLKTEGKNPFKYVTISESKENHLTGLYHTYVYVNGKLEIK